MGNYPNRIIYDFKNYTNGSVYPHNEIKNLNIW